MSDKPKVRFKGSIRIHVRDNIFGNAMVVNTDFAGNKQEDIIKKAKERIDKYATMISTEINEKTLHSHAKSLMEHDGWSVKKVKNHFARYGIDIDPFINPQKKLPVEKVK